MSGADWHDPFAEDEAARAREARRAEREARRQKNRESLGEKVGEREAAASEPPPVAPDPAPTPASEQPPAETPAPAEPVAPPRPQETPSAHQPADAQSTPAAEPAGEPASRPVTEQETADRPVPADATPVATTPPRGAGPSTAAGRSRPLGRGGGGRGSGPSHRDLMIRRGIGLLVLVGALVLGAVGANAVIDRLSSDPVPEKAPGKAKVSELTIPEGLTRAQIAELVKEEGVKGDYMEATKSVKGFDPAKYDAGGVESLEGFLFPALYELPKKPTVDDLVPRQLEAFEANLSEVDLSYAKSRGLNTYDVVKIASLVEEEIQVPEERPLAAAVIYNRLKAGTPLGIDATIRYEDQNYDEQLTESRLAEDTPYNSRIRTGLPPTPIANPGLASLQAAAKPAKSDAFFFVVKPGTCGEHVFVETEEEFLQAEAEYQEALQAEGGSPTEC